MAHIYALIDPLFPTVYRYIGKTINAVSIRLYHHMYRIESCANLHKRRWALRVVSEGRAVSVVTLEDCPDSEQDAREIHWIRKAKSLGHPLTNLTDGGEGGVPHPEVRLKISKALIGRKRPPHVIEASRKNGKTYIGDKNPNYGKRWPIELRKKASDLRIGIPLSAECKEHIKLALQGRNNKIAANDVHRIFEMRHKLKMSQQSIATHFGIGQSQISRILLGKKWGHLSLEKAWG